ncbi:fatty acid--CoA ligase family protein [Streptomyces sp. CSDS2]|uniref:class I adenylate-forming enzyme family protein n=1 Tax=Streptomyces sp. CSDS2 TaxID=3055051 RepID=UPI0025AFD484|nr:fatty acid--CoA ligase family protein [Streptomyces sp. CSDS2]MDN3261572.1 fatty acid--CoA ligase family protein [Streptomyces sp. CSDS2]
MDEKPGEVFPQALIDAFRDAPDLPAFEYRGREVTRGQVLVLIAGFVRGLRGAGLTAGSRVVLDTGVTPEAFAVRVAAHVVGCQVVALRPGLTPEHLRDILARDISAVVTDDLASRPALAAEAGGTPLLDTGGALRPPASFTPGPGDLTARGGRDGIGVIHLTSGSTGRPKGTMVTYGALSEGWALRPGRWTDRTRRLAARYARFLLFGTLSSAVMFEHLCLSLLGGGTAVIPDQPPRFPEVFAEHRVSACMTTVPRLYGILDAVRDRAVDTSSLRALVVAGSPLAPHRLTEAAGLLGPVVHHAYGQTETGMLTVLEPGELAADPGLADSVGRPLDTVEMTVRDSSGRDLPAGRTGEVWVRLADAFCGYWEDPRETAEVLRDGWVRTRDLGRLDARGYLRLSGRTRDIVIVNAVVHYAGPIERVLASHPDIDQAYVVGVPDDRTGEAIHAFVVPHSGAVPVADALRELVARELGEAAAPVRVVGITEVPVAPSGKPDKAALRALLEIS